MVWRLQKAFSKISYRRVRNGKEELPADEDYGFEQKTAKVRYLNQFLVERCKGLTLARAIGISAKKWEALNSGFSIPSRAVMKRLAVYFSLPPKMLLDDEEKLPSFDELKIDEDLAAIQRNDLDETMNYYKNKHYLTRNYRVLSHPMRVRLVLSSFLILLPLAAFTGYCSYTILQNRFESLEKIASNDVDSASKKFEESYIANHTKDETNSQGLSYCDVKLGVQIQKIFDIQPSNECFSVAMKVWFDFNQDDFHTMYTNYKSDTIADAASTTYDKDMDYFTVNSSDEIRFGADEIPDRLELATPYDLFDHSPKPADPSNPTTAERKRCGNT
jgi:transcriptional regulator with XRE-family HTH domain